MPSSKLTENDIRLILNSDASNAELGRQIGVTREAIREVRAGVRYASVAPELPRWSNCPGGASCYNCVNWRGGTTTEKPRGFCLFGFPDPHEEGARFARLCNNFRLKPVIP